MARGQPVTTAQPESPPQSRPAIFALMGWLFFVLLAMYALMFGGGYEGIHATSWRTVSLALIGVTLAGWLVLAWRRPAWRPGTAIWPALVAPLVALVVSLVLAEHWRLGLEYVAWAFLLVAIYLLLVRIMRTEFVRLRIGGLALVIGLVIGLAYLGSVLLMWLDWWDLLGRFAMPPLRPNMAGMPFGGPSVVATVMVLITVLAGVGLGTASRARVASLALLVVIAVAIVIVTGSRSAWIGLGGAIVLVGGLWLLVHRGSVSRGARDRRTIALLAGGAMAVLVLAMTLGPRLLDRLVNSGDGGRPSYFAAALRMFEDAPVTGLGPGAWAARRIAYLEPGEVDFSVPHAHNVYLQTAAETGLVGIVAGVIAALAVGWLIYRSLRSGDDRRMAWAWALLFGTTYLAIVSLVGFYASLPGVVMLWVIPLAMLDGLATGGIGVPRRLAVAATGRVAVAALAVACAASIAVLGWAESSATTLASATTAADEGDWTVAAEAATAAVEADPHPAHQLMRALSAMASGEWASAIEKYEASLEVDDLPHAWVGLARATLENGGSEGDVVAALESAMRMGRQDAAIMVAVADTFERLGRTTDADDAMTTAVQLQPGLAPDLVWGTGPQAVARRDRIVESAIEQAGGAGWRVALGSGDVAQARELLVSSGVESGTAFDFVEALSGDADARRRIQESAEANPTDPSLLLTAAALSERAGDHELAARYRRLALFRQEGVSYLGLPVTVGEGCDDGTPAPARTELHGLWAYRRDLPRRLLPVGAPCLLLATEPRAADE